jgi:hypothetical protein
MRIASLPQYNKLGHQGPFLACSGIIAPLLLLTLVIVLGFLEPGYDRGTDMIRILERLEGARDTAFNIGVGLTGVLLLALAIGMGGTDSTAQAGTSTCLGEGQGLTTTAAISSD